MRLSPEHIISELDALGKGDPEAAHGHAEGLLMAYLRSWGHGDIADAYERARDRVGFYYA